MSYENPDQPEGINVSDEHPVRELFVLLTGVIAVVSVLIILLSSIASWLAQYIPFSAEQQLAEMIGIEQLFTPHIGTEQASNETSQQRQAFIQQLSYALIEKTKFPYDIPVRVHYSPDDTVNAFATIGAHVVVYEGLVSRLPNENALAMVLAHELGHIKLRHPIVATSRGLTVSMALGSIFGLTDNAYVGRIVEWIGYSSTLSFSRDQEREADEFAADLLINYYGHLDGATGLFEVFRSVDADSDTQTHLPGTDFLNTHPGISERIQTLLQRKAASGVSGDARALPW